MTKKFYIKDQTYFTLSTDLGWFDWLFYDKYKKDNQKMIFEAISLGLMRYFFKDDSVIMPKTYILLDKDNNLAIASKQENEGLIKPSYNKYEQFQEQIGDLDVISAWIADFDVIGLNSQNILMTSDNQKLYKFDASESLNRLRRPIGWRFINFRDLKQQFNIIISNIDNQFSRFLSFTILTFIILFISPIIIPSLICYQFLYNIPFNYIHPKIKSIFKPLNNQDKERLNNFYISYFGVNYEAIENKITDGHSIYSYINLLTKAHPISSLNKIYKTHIKADNIKSSLKKLFELNNETLFLIINKIPDEVCKPSLKAELFDLLAERRNLIFRKLGNQVDSFTNRNEVYKTHPYLRSSNTFVRAWEGFKKNFGIYPAKNNYYDLLKEYDKNKNNFESNAKIDFELLKKYLNQKKVVRPIDDFEISKTLSFGIETNQSDIKTGYKRHSKGK